MKCQCLITYRTTMEDRARYAAAAKELKTDVTKAIREALENLVRRAEFHRAEKAREQDGKPEAGAEQARVEP